MAGAQAEVLVRHDAKERTGELADEDLVEQFLRGQQIGSDDAFIVLVKRHGPMVLGICRFVLDQEADAEDAFQATFLILARKAPSIRNRALLAVWLHEVAYRTAVKARFGIIRRRFRERQSVSMSPPQFVPDRQHEDAAWNELRPVLHDEVRRLPDKYRLPVILSYLEGKTNEEVAELLHWPIGTVKVRLSRARALLQSRLMRRGLTLSAAFLRAALADGAIFAEVVPPELVRRTMLFVQRSTAPSASPGSTPPPDKPWMEASFAKQRGATIDMPRKHPKFINLPLVVLISVLSVSTVIALGVAFGGSGNFSNLRSAFSAFLPSRATATSCP